VDAREYRAASRETWRRMAGGWSARRRQLWEVTHRVGEWMVERLDPQPGETIVEVAAGPGDTGFPAAERIGPEGRLISTDFAAEMVESAERQGRALGLENVEYRVMDAEQMDLGDDSADGVLCRWGYMLMADPAAALHETHRVLRDGGRLALSVWSGPEHNPWAAIPGRVLVERGYLPAPEPGAPGIFGWADRDHVRRMLTEAGFATPELDELPLSWRFADLDDFWSFTRELAGALALVIARLPDDEQAAVRDEVGTRLEPHRAGDAYELPGRCLNAFTRC
jgi:ubiquinone/menaquinone biosynthesis C-methylase UbiE